MDGYCAIVVDKVLNKEYTISGNESNTTNQRMELLAAVMGLYSVKKPSRIEIFTDSQYLVNGITKWVYAWRKRGWRTSKSNKNKPVKHRDLWETLLELTKPHKVKWTHIKGHSGYTLNENLSFCYFL